MPIDTLQNLNTLLIIQHLNNDMIATLQASNAEVLKAVEHLKTDLKPIPKTTVETYGVLIGAAIGIIGSVILFALTKWKEKKVFLAQLYGEITSSGHALRGAIMLKGVEQITFEAALKRSKMFPGSKEHDLMLAESNSKLDKYTTETLNAGKDFFAKVGTYVFVKGGTTIVNKFINTIDESGFAFKATSIGDEVTQLEQVNAITQQDKARFEIHFNTNINNSVIGIEQAVLKGK